MSVIAGIDPGPERSALVEYDCERNAVLRHVEAANDTILDILLLKAEPQVEPTWACQTAVMFDGWPMFSTVVIEVPTSFGLRAGKDVFRTAFWSGRFFGEISRHIDCKTLGRKDIVQHLCGNRTSGDTDVRRAIMFRWGTDAKKVFGTPKEPGPLHGIVGHKMAALAVAVVWAEKHAMDRRLGIAKA